MATEKYASFIEAFHCMWDNYPEPVRLIDRSFTIIAGNKRYMERSARFIGTRCCDAGAPELHRGCQAMAALSSGETKITSTEMNGVHWDSYWVPVEGCPDLYVHFTNGINEYVAKMTAEAK